jgi:hypothetical protein
VIATETELEINITISNVFHPTVHAIRDDFAILGIIGMLGIFGPFTGKKG